MNRLVPMMTGDPVEDWKNARKVLEQIKDFSDLFRDVRMVRLFGARDTLAAGLASLWLSSGRYTDAANLVKRILDQEKLVASDREPKRMHANEHSQVQGERVRCRGVGGRRICLSVL